MGSSIIARSAHFSAASGAPWAVAHRIRLFKRVSFVSGCSGEQEEVDRLRIAQAEDRQAIGQLLAMGVGPPDGGPSEENTAERMRLVRRVYVPSERSDRLQMEVEKSFVLKFGFDIVL